MFLSEIQRKYGGFIVNGKLVLQCPFHGRVYPTAYIWEEKGEIKAQCKMGCSEEKLLDYFLGGKKKIHYAMPDEKVDNVVVDLGLSAKECRLMHREYIQDRLNELENLKRQILNLNRKLRAIYFQNILVSVKVFWEINRGIALTNIFLKVIDLEKKRLKKYFDNYKVIDLQKRFIHRNSLTNEMIKKARQVSVELLYPFKKGRAICPFHPDTKPSLVVWKKRNLIHCFGCNRTWDAISFIQELKQLSFKEAVLWLIDLE